MSLYIITEPEYEETLWATRLYTLINELKLKRIPYNRIKKISDIRKREPSVVIAVGSSYGWTSTIIKECNEAHIPVIISSSKFGTVTEGSYSCVSSDWQDVAMTLNRYLSCYNKSKIALYGVNHNSDADLNLVEVFYSLIHFQPQDVPYVFENEGSLADCYERLKKDLPHYDAIICVNDYVALYLIDRLKQEDEKVLERLFIISFNNFILSQIHSPSVTSFSEDGESVAKALIGIYQLLLKSSDFTSVHVQIRQKLHIRQSTQYRPLPEDIKLQPEDGEPVPFSHITGKKDYFESGEITQYNRLESMLEHCDKLDIFILLKLLHSHSYESIANDVFASVGTVKYRLRKMMQQSAAASRTDLMDLLRTHVNEKNLQDYYQTLRDMDTAF